MNPIDRDGMATAVKALLAQQSPDLRSITFQTDPQELSEIGLTGILLLLHGPGPTVFVLDQDNKMRRVQLKPGQHEDFTNDVRDEIALLSSERPSAVILFTEARSGPEEGEVHFGVFAWIDQDGIQIHHLAVFEA